MASGGVGGGEIMASMRYSFMQGLEEVHQHLKTE